MTQRPESLLEGKNRSFTGAEYLASLHDGREVYFNGARVKDVTTHPAFRNSTVSIAKLYDALHELSRESGAELTRAAECGRLRRWGCWLVRLLAASIYGRIRPKQYFVCVDYGDVQFNKKERYFPQTLPLRVAHRVRGSAAAQAHGAA